MEQHIVKVFGKSDTGSLAKTAKSVTTLGFGPKTKSPSPNVSMKVISCPTKILIERKKMYRLVGILGTLSGREMILNKH